MRLPFHLSESSFYQLPPPLELLPKPVASSWPPRRSVDTPTRQRNHPRQMAVPRRLSQWSWPYPQLQQTAVQVRHISANFRPSAFHGVPVDPPPRKTCLGQLDQEYSL